MEFQTELLEQLIAPLLDQAPWGHDQDAVRIRPHDELTNVEPCHNGLTSARVIREDEPQGLARKHGFIDGRDLVRQGLHIGSVNRHHWVEQESEVDALRLTRKLKGCAVAVEQERALRRGRADQRLVGASKEAFFHPAFRGAIDELDGALAHRDHRDHGHDRCQFDSHQACASDDVFELHAWDSFLLGLAYRRRIWHVGARVNRPGCPGEFVAGLRPTWMEPPAPDSTAGRTPSAVRAR